jgi:hypothetical protein
MGATVLVALAVTSVTLGDFLLVATPQSIALAPVALVGITGIASAGSNRAFVSCWSAHQSDLGPHTSCSLCL